MDRFCARCHESKQAREFYGSNRSWCKECVRQYERDRRAAKRPAREQLPDGTKRCPACKRVLGLDPFRKRSNGRPDAYCGPCHRKRNEVYRKARVKRRARTRSKRPNVTGLHGPIGSEWAEWRRTGRKLCPGCRERKPMAEFQWDAGRSRPYGWCKGCSYKSHRAWLRTPAGRRSTRKYNQHPERRRRNTVRMFTNAAVRLGILVRQPCQVEGCSVKKVQAHHTDYSRPLEVEWLCRRHHAATHNGEPLKEAPRP